MTPCIPALEDCAARAELQAFLTGGLVLAVVLIVVGLLLIRRDG